LRAVAVRDHDTFLLEQRLERRHGAAEVHELLGGRSALAGPHQRVPAERYHYMPE
jgi:hypothetical protein